MKVLLVYPNSRWLENYEKRTLWTVHPYNLCLLAAMIRKDYDIEILDATIDDLSHDDFAMHVIEKQPDIVGTSTLTDEYGQVGLITAKIVKEVNPGTITVLGGVHAISDPMSIITDPNVDYVVNGEGEYVFKELCAFFDGKGELPKKGILYKKDGKIIDTGTVDFIKDLDKLPLPSYDLVDFSRYTTTIQREGADAPRAFPYARILTARGCPFRCCFCEVGKISGKIPRCRSPESIIKEIEWLKDTYGIKALIFDDDNLFLFKDRAMQIFQTMIDKKMNLKWNAIAVAVFKLDEEILDVMKESGCQYLCISVESGVERVLKDIIHKPLDLDYAKRIIKKIKSLDIDLAANFVVGFPGETWAEIRQTIKFAEEIGIDYVKFFIATPLPNTELYKMAKEQDCLIDGFSFEKHLWTDGVIETDEFKPQDLKTLRAYEWDRINFSTPAKTKKIAKMMNITVEQLKKIRKETLARAHL